MIGGKKTEKFHAAGGQCSGGNKDSKNAVLFAAEQDAVNAGRVQSAR